MNNRKRQRSPSPIATVLVAGLQTPLREEDHSMDTDTVYPQPTPNSPSKSCSTRHDDKVVRKRPRLYSPRLPTPPATGSRTNFMYQRYGGYNSRSPSRLPLNRVDGDLQSSMEDVVDRTESVGMIGSDDGHEPVVIVKNDPQFLNFMQERYGRVLQSSLNKSLAPAPLSRTNDTIWSSSQSSVEDVAVRTKSLDMIGSDDGQDGAKELVHAAHLESATILDPVAAPSSGPNDCLEELSIANKSSISPDRTPHGHHTHHTDNNIHSILHSSLSMESIVSRTYSINQLARGDDDNDDDDDDDDDDVAGLQPSQKSISILHSSLSMESIVSRTYSINQLARDDDDDNDVVDDVAGLQPSQKSIAPPHFPCPLTSILRDQPESVPLPSLNPVLPAEASNIDTDFEQHPITHGLIIASDIRRTIRIPGHGGHETMEDVPCGQPGKELDAARVESVPRQSEDDDGVRVADEHNFLKARPISQGFPYPTNECTESIVLPSRSASPVMSDNDYPAATTTTTPPQYTTQLINQSMESIVLPSRPPSRLILDEDIPRLSKATMMSQGSANQRSESMESIVHPSRSASQVMSDNDYPAAGTTTPSESASQLSQMGFDVNNSRPSKTRALSQQPSYLSNDSMESIVFPSRSPSLIVPDEHDPHISGMWSLSRYVDESMESITPLSRSDLQIILDEDYPRYSAMYESLESLVFPSRSPSLVMSDIDHQHAPYSTDKLIEADNPLSGPPSQIISDEDYTYNSKATLHESMESIVFPSRSTSPIISYKQDLRIPKTTQLYHQVSYDSDLVPTDIDEEIDGGDLSFESVVPRSSSRSAIAQDDVNMRSLALSYIPQHCSLESVVFRTASPYPLASDSDEEPISVPMRLVTSSSESVVSRTDSYQQVVQDGDQTPYNSPYNSLVNDRYTQSMLDHDMDDASEAGFVPRTKSLFVLDDSDHSNHDDISMTSIVPWTYTRFQIADEEPLTPRGQTRYNNDVDHDVRPPSRTKITPIPDRRTKSGFRETGKKQKRPMSKVPRPLTAHRHSFSPLPLPREQDKELFYDSERTIEASDGEEDDNDLFVPFSPQQSYNYIHSDDSDKGENFCNQATWNDEHYNISPDADSDLDLWSHPNPVVQGLYEKFASDHQNGRHFAHLTQLLYTTPPAVLLPTRDSLPHRAGYDIQQGSPCLEISDDDEPASKPVKNVPRPRKPEKNSLASAVRSFAFQLMGRSKALVGPDPIESIPFSRVVAFVQNSRLELGPKEEDFRLFLDFSKSQTDKDRELCNTWNKKAADVFVQCFLVDYPEYSGRQQSALVRDAFIGHIKTLKAHFTKYNLQVPRVVNTWSQANLKASRIQLRRSRCTRRVTTLDRYKHVPRLREIGERLSKCLTWQCCSGDETDRDEIGPDGSLAITKLPWRAPEVRKLVKTLDNLYILLRFPKDSNPTPGSLPTHRFDPEMCIPASISSVDPFFSAPVPNLPCNCYSGDFLASLSPEEVEKLNMQPFLDITVPPEITMLAETAESVVNRKSRPLPRDYDI